MQPECSSQCSSLRAGEATKSAQIEGIVTNLPSNGCPEPGPPGSLTAPRGSVCEAFESDPGAIRVSGPIPSKDAEMIGSQIVVAMQRLGISADKAYTIDD